MTGGPQWSVRERRGARTDSGYNPGGLWAGFGARPNRSPVAFSYFLISFLFYFSDF
jgi:hypothetical protein